MVRGLVFVFLVPSIAALDLPGLARKHVRKPAILAQIYRVLAHCTLPNLHALASQRRRLSASAGWAPVFRKQDNNKDKGRHAYSELTSG